MMPDIKSEIKYAFINNKVAICISAAIFLISLLLGYFLEPYLHSLFNPLVDELTEQVKSGVVQLTFKDIFSNNIRIAFYMFVLGLFFCFSAVLLSFNGFFIGYYVGSANDLGNVLLLIVPHGIFEFSSCILACASGFVLFNFVFKFIRTMRSLNGISIFKKIYCAADESFDKLKEAAILFIIASILMIIAGIIEVYFTLPFAEVVWSILGALSKS